MFLSLCHNPSQEGCHLIPISQGEQTEADRGQGILDQGHPDKKG